MTAYENPPFNDQFATQILQVIAKVYIKLS